MNFRISASQNFRISEFQKANQDFAKITSLHQNYIKFIYMKFTSSIFIVEEEFYLARAEQICYLLYAAWGVISLTTNARLQRSPLQCPHTCDKRDNAA